MIFMKMQLDFSILSEMIILQDVSNLRMWTS